MHLTVYLIQFRLPGLVVIAEQPVQSHDVSRLGLLRIVPLPRPLGHYLVVRSGSGLVEGEEGELLSRLLLVEAVSSPNNGIGELIGHFFCCCCCRGLRRGGSGRFFVSLLPRNGITWELRDRSSDGCGLTVGNRVFRVHGLSSAIVSSRDSTPLPLDLFDGVNSGAMDGAVGFGLATTAAKIWNLGSKDLLPSFFPQLTRC